MSISVYYRESIILDRPVGNNAFVYDERKLLFGKAEIVVPQLVAGNLDDVQLGDSIVFAEEVDGEVKEFVGLRNLVHLVIARKEQGDGRGDPGDSSKSWIASSSLHSSSQGQLHIYIMDNHNHALYCRYKEVLAGNIQRGLPVIHIDQHSDMKDPIGWIDPAKEDHLDYIATYVNEVCTIADFIQPALRSGLVSECMQVRTENQLLMVNGEGGMKHYHYILDIDIDFWAPEMGIEEFDRTIEKTRQLIAGASLVTIATSPCFIEQERAVEIVKRLLSISS